MNTDLAAAQITASHGGDDYNSPQVGADDAPDTPAAESQAGAELSVLLERARDWWNSATPEQREQMKREQAESWVRAEMAWGDEGTRMMPTPDAPAPASAPAVSGKKLKWKIAELVDPAIRRKMARKPRIDSACIRAEAIIKLIGPPPHADAAADDVAALRKCLAEVLAFARIKFGNLDPDANAAFERAEAAFASTQRKEG